MPTRESAEAFAKLTAARSRLNHVTHLLNECHASFLKQGQAARERYAELQTLWDEAFSSFQRATDEFASTVEKLQRVVELNRSPRTDQVDRSDEQKQA